MRDAGVPGASVLCAGRGRRACARGRAADCDRNVVPCAGVAGPLSMRGRAQLPRTQLLGSGKRRGDPGAGLGGCGGDNVWRREGRGRDGAGFRRWWSEGSRWKARLLRAGGVFVHPAVLGGISPKMCKQGVPKWERQDRASFCLLKLLCFSWVRVSVIIVLYN